MRAFSAGELAALQGTQESAMQDTCVVEVHSDGSTNAYGPAEPVYTDGSTYPCGYAASTTIGGWREVMMNAQVPVTDAVLRLPLSAQAGNLDRVRVTHRFGVALATAERFEIVSIARRGPSGLQLRLKRVGA